MEVQAFTDAGASEDEVASVRTVLRKQGFEGEVEAIIPPQGESTYWLLLLAIPPAAFLQAFFGEAGKDAWQGLKRFLGDLKAVRDQDRAGSGHVVVRPFPPTRNHNDRDELVARLMGWIRARDGATILTLSADLPDQALQKLFELNLNEYGAGYLWWDDQRQEWRPDSER